MERAKDVTNSAGVRVLASVSGDYVFGGVEAYLETLFPALGDYGISMDVFVPGRIAEGKRDVFNRYSVGTIECGLGFATKLSSVERTRLYVRAANRLCETLRSSHYDVVHANTGVPLASATILRVAKKCHVCTRIAHSHNNNSVLDERFVKNIETAAQKMRQLLLND